MWALSPISWLSAKESLLFPFPGAPCPDHGGRSSIWDIVSALNLRGETLVSPQFHREFGGARKPVISRRFKGLESGGWTGEGREEGTGGTKARRKPSSLPARLNPARSVTGRTLRRTADSALVGSGVLDDLRKSMRTLKGGNDLRRLFDARTDRCLIVVAVCVSTVRAGNAFSLRNRVAAVSP